MKLFCGMLLSSLLGLPLQAALQARPVPALSEQAGAERQVRDAFSEDYSKAKRSPAEQAALAQKLLGQGRQDQDNAAVGFVLLRDARDMAAGAGDIKTLTAAAEQMSKSYQIAPSVALLPALQTASKAALTPTAEADVVEACLASAQKLIAKDEYEAAATFMSVAEQAARKADNPALSTRVTERAASIRSLRGAYQRAAGAIEKLKMEPDNPSLNFMAARFYCFDKDDWEQGLVYLSRGSDTELKELATLDLKAPATAADQTSLADRYWQLAARSPSFMKTPLENRARYWYAKALPLAEGLQKAKLEERLYTQEVRKLHDMITPGDTNVRPTADGVDITGKGTIFMTGEVKVPLRIDAIAKTESTNIYLYYGDKGTVVFNWEVGSQQLWFHDPASGGIHSIEGQGRITPETWAHITWVIDPTTCTIMVDGKTRATFHGKYAGLSAKAGIGGVDAKVSVRQLDVTELAGRR